MFPSFILSLHLCWSESETQVYILIWDSLVSYISGCFNLSTLKQPITAHQANEGMLGTVESCI